jgi:hypothetical protein
LLAQPRPAGVAHALVEPALWAAGAKADLRGSKPDGGGLDLLEQEASQALAAVRRRQAEQPQGHATGRRTRVGPEGQRAGKVEDLRQLLERGNRPDHVAHPWLVAHAWGWFTPIPATGRRDPLPVTGR